MLLRFFRGWRLTAAALGIALAFCGLLAETVLEARNDIHTRATQAARNLVLAVSEEMSRTVEGLGLSLAAVAENSRVPGFAELGPQLRQLVLFDRAVTAKHLGYVLLLDEHGAVVADSRASAPVAGDFSDRDYFTVHATSSDIGLYVSGPIISRITGERIIAFSRRLTQADGGFAGVAVGTIRLDAVRQLFEALELGPNGSMTLFRDDGTILMRVPYLDALLGSDVSHTEVYRRAVASPGTQFVAKSSLDGTTRLHSTAAVRNAPLRVAVSFSIDDVDAGWLRHALNVGLAATFLAAFLIGASVLLRRELERRRSAEHAAQLSATAASESEAGFRLLAENCSDMVSRIGADGVRRYVSPASLRLLGRAPKELVGHRPQEEIHPNDRGAVVEVVERLRSLLAEEATVAYRTRRADGIWIWVESTIRVVRDATTRRPDGLVAVSRDVTERKRVEAELARLATLDGLTGMANRRTLDGGLEREWRRCAAAELPISILLIDVDKFKALNDTQGHQRGDECLQQIGAVLAATVRRACDLAARYGGEEFAVLLPETDAAGAAAVAERVRADIEVLALSHPASGVGPGVVTVSVGGATLWPVSGEDGPDELVRMADEALYEAKGTGRNRAVHATSSCPRTRPAAAVAAATALDQ